MIPTNNNQIPFRVSIIDQATQEMKRIQRNTENSLNGMTRSQQHYTRSINDTHLKVLQLRREQQTASRARIREINQEIRALNQLNAVNRRGLTQANTSRVGGMSSLIGIGGGMGVAAVGAMVAAEVAKYVIKTGAQYSQGESQMQALVQNSAQTASLSDTALALGRASIFTSKQVLDLQITLLKYGFTVDEVNKSTQGLITIAEATGTTLADVSEVGSATLRGFGLEAQEMSRVADVMAASFVNSALDITKFRESMKYVAPVAKQVGFSLEETTAHLSALANAGISGSQAGTSLRRIYSEAGILSARGNISIQEAFSQIAREGMTVADAYDEVGRTAQTALAVLADSAPVLDMLTEKYNNAGGAAKKMSDIMKDNLLGDFEQLKSSVEGFTIQLNKTGGSIDNFLRDLTQYATKTFDVLGLVEEKMFDISGISLFDIFLGAATFGMSPIMKSTVSSLKNVGSSNGDDAIISTIMNDNNLSDDRKRELVTKLIGEEGYNSLFRQPEMMLPNVRLRQNRFGVPSTGLSMTGNAVDMFTNAPGATPLEGQTKVEGGWKWIYRNGVWQKESQVSGSSSGSSGSSITRQAAFDAWKQQQTVNGGTISNEAVINAGFSEFVRTKDPKAAASRGLSDKTASTLTELSRSATIKEINLNITNMNGVSGDIVVNNLTEGKLKVGEAMTEVLIAALQDAQGYASFN